MWLKVRGPLLIAVILLEVANDMAGKSNERELIQTYTESEAASLFLWSVTACTDTQCAFTLAPPSLNTVVFSGVSC